MRFQWLIVCVAGWICLETGGLFAAGATAQTLRLGYFPNVTHAQALYGRATGAFEKRLGKPIQWIAFNAGPTAIEALFANEVDATYVGPGPAINGYVRSHGEKFVIVSGAAMGGAALVVAGDSGIASDRDFGGKTIATPQLGNTQDIAARVWLRDHGYMTTAQGGTVNLVSLSNPDQLTMFREKQIAAAWTVEPWVSRLVLEAGGRVYFREETLWPRGAYATTLLVVSRAFLRDHPDDVRNLLRAHVAITRLLQEQPEAALLNAQIKKETGRALRDDVITAALKNVRLTWQPGEASIKQYAQWAYDIHFLREQPDLRRMYDFSLLNQVLAERALPAVTNAP